MRRKSKAREMAIEFAEQIDEALFAIVRAAAHNYAVEYPGGSPYIPNRECWIVTARDKKGMVAGFAVWQIWEERAFIGLAWTAPEYRMRGVYWRILGALREEAARRGLKGLSACVDCRNHVSNSVHGRVMKPRLVFYEADLDAPCGTQPTLGPAR